MKKCEFCYGNYNSADLKANKYYCSQCLNKLNKENIVMDYDKFKMKLEQEYEYHLDGGTNYRQKTAKLAIEVASKNKIVNSFFDQTESRDKVSSLFPDLDKHRKDDVSKMLRIIANSIYIEQTTSNEVIQYRDKLMKNKLKLIPPNTKK